MPSWTTDEGSNLFMKKQCKHCLQWIETDDQGEILDHTCLSYGPKSTTTNEEE